MAMLDIVSTETIGSAIYQVILKASPKYLHVLV